MLGFFSSSKITALFGPPAKVCQARRVVRTILLGIVIVRGTAPKGYLVCSPKPTGQSGQGEANRAVAQKRPVSSAFKAEYSHLAGLSGETGRGFRVNGSYNDAKLQGIPLC